MSDDLVDNLRHRILVHAAAGARAVRRSLLAKLHDGIDGLSAQPFSFRIGKFLQPLPVVLRLSQFVTEFAVLLVFLQDALRHDHRITRLQQIEGIVQRLPGQAGPCVRINRSLRADGSHFTGLREQFPVQEELYFDRPFGLSQRRRPVSVHLFRLIRIPFSVRLLPFIVPVSEVFQIFCRRRIFRRVHVFLAQIEAAGSAVDEGEMKFLLRETVRKGLPARRIELRIGFVLPGRMYFRHHISVSDLPGLRKDGRLAGFQPELTGLRVRPALAYTLWKRDLPSLLHQLIRDIFLEFPSQADRHREGRFFAPARHRPRSQRLGHGQIAPAVIVREADVSAAAVLRHGDEDSFPVRRHGLHIIAARGRKLRHFVGDSALQPADAQRTARAHACECSFIGQRRPAFCLHRSRRPPADPLSFFCGQGHKTLRPVLLHFRSLDPEGKRCRTVRRSLMRQVLGQVQLFPAVGVGKRRRRTFHRGHAGLRFGPADPVAGSVSSVRVRHLGDPVLDAGRIEAQRRHFPAPESEASGSRRIFPAVPRASGHAPARFERRSVVRIRSRDTRAGGIHIVKFPARKRCELRLSGRFCLDQEGELRLCVRPSLLRIQRSLKKLLNIDSRPVFVRHGDGPSAVFRAGIIGNIDPRIFFPQNLLCLFDRDARHVGKLEIRGLTRAQPEASAAVRRVETAVLLRLSLPEGIALHAECPADFLSVLIPLQPVELKLKRRAGGRVPHRGRHV